jgi:catechol 2,3-dioxygenase
LSTDHGIAPPRFRLPDLTRLGAVHLQIADLSRSLHYYQQVLGLQVLERGDGAAALGAEGGEQPLVWLHERPGARRVPPAGLLGLYHFAILLPDRAALGRFLTHLGTLHAHAGSADHAVSEALYLTDPDGLGIEVYADRPRSAWRYHGQQLYMTTEPLDVRSLLAAGGDRKWSGMPAATTMGHVHLHVGDISRAAAFYHDAVGLDQVVWSYPGALFLSAGGYHHHLGNNTWSSGPPASDQDARLLSWTIVLPSAADVDAVAASIASAGHSVTRDGTGATASDPWGTAVRFTAG